MREAWARVRALPADRRATAPLTVALILLALIPRLAVQHGSGTMGLDMEDWLSWSRDLIAGDWRHFYARSASDYLPGYLYVLWAVGKLQLVMPHLPGIVQGRLPSTELLYELPAMLADIATVLVIYHAGRRWTSPGAALLAAAVYAVNPGVLYNSSRWGQVDSVPALFETLATVWAVERRPLRSGLALGLSILIKPTALVLVPPLALAFVCRRRPSDALQFGAALAATGVALFLPFLPPGEGLPGFAVRIFNVTAGHYPYLTINAFNLWAAYLGGVRYMSDSLVVLGLSYHAWGWALELGLCGAVCALICSTMGRGEDAGRYLLPGAALLMLGFFVLLTRMHERHLLPALPLLALCASLWPRYWLPYVWLSAAYLLNLWFALHLLLPPLPRLLSDGQIVLIALGNVAMLGLIAALLVRPSPPAPLPAAGEG